MGNTGKKDLTIETTASDSVAFSRGSSNVSICASAQRAAFVQGAAKTIRRDRVRECQAVCAPLVWLCECAPNRQLCGGVPPGRTARGVEHEHQSKRGKLQIDAAKRRKARVDPLEIARGHPARPAQGRLQDAPSASME